jgi:hypothetical protein
MQMRKRKKKRTWNIIFKERHPTNAEVTDPQTNLKVLGHGINSTKMT